MDCSGIDKEPHPVTGHATERQGRNTAANRDFAIEDFVPRPGVRGGHMQTLVSHFLPRIDHLPVAESRLFRVEDDVQVLCYCHWQPLRQQAATVIIVHGLEGSSESGYVTGTANKAWAEGMNVVRMNVRNCGGTESLTPTLYHSGMSGDIAAVVRELIGEDALPAIAIAGFSMGGNQVLKLMGEWGAGLLGGVPSQVRAAAAVSPSIDLSASADALHQRSNRIYEWRFLLSLRSRVQRKARLFPDLYQARALWWNSIREFDEAITAPHCGFRDAEDYYTRASASRVLDRISIPTLVIHAKDDPFIRMLPESRARLLANPHLTYIETAHGGHCGFLAQAQRTKIQGGGEPGHACDAFDGRWAERQIVRFFQHYACEATR